MITNGLTSIWKRFSIYPENFRKKGGQVRQLGIFNNLNLLKSNWLTLLIFLMQFSEDF